MGNRVADYTSMAHTSPLSSGSVGGDAIAVRDEVAGQEASALALLPIRMLLTGVCVVLLERVGEDMRAGLVTGRDEIEEGIAGRLQHRLDGREARVGHGCRRQSFCL